jgi:hypothetical protein
MLKISNEQYDRINESFRAYRRTQLLRRLRAEGSVSANMTDQDATGILNQTIVEGAVLGMDDDESVLRLGRIVFARMEGRVTNEKAALVGNVLANEQVPPQDRLRFIEKHVLAIRL